MANLASQKKTSQHMKVLNQACSDFWTSFRRTIQHEAVPELLLDKGPPSAASEACWRANKCMCSDSGRVHCKMMKRFHEVLASEHPAGSTMRQDLAQGAVVAMVASFERVAGSDNLLEIAKRWFFIADCLLAPFTAYLHIMKLDNPFADDANIQIAAEGYTCFGSLVLISDRADLTEWEFIRSRDVSKNRY